MHERDSVRVYNGRKKRQREGYLAGILQGNNSDEQGMDGAKQQNVVMW